MLNWAGKYINFEKY